VEDTFGMQAHFAEFEKKRTMDLGPRFPI
jgi:hypothetical protein